VPFSPLHLLLFVFLLGFLLAFVQVGILTLAFDKLGLSPAAGFLLLFASLAGSAVDVPVATLRGAPPPEPLPEPVRWGLLRVRRAYAGRTVIAVNVGGCVIPVLFSLYLLASRGLPLDRTLLATAIVVAVAYAASRPVPGLGIAMPALLAPVTAALAALAVGGAHSAPIAYVAGTLGVLVGADLLHLGDIRRLGTPMASIGGAGTFDGIFLAGVLAALLA